MTHQIIARKMTESDAIEETTRKLDRLLEMFETTFGRDNPKTVDILNMKANHLLKQGDNLSAENVYRDLLKRSTKVYTADHLIIAVFKHNFAICLFQQGEERGGEAINLLKEARPVMQRLPSGHRLRKVFEETWAIAEKMLNK